MREVSARLRRDLDASALARQPHFAAVDAIEVRNAVRTDRENQLASAVALALDMPVTFGSDAHHVDEIGRQRMKADALPSSVADLCELRRSSRPSASTPADSPVLLSNAARNLIV